jgi:hypothetical protein
VLHCVGHVTHANVERVHCVDFEAARPVVGVRSCGGFCRLVLLFDLYLEILIILSFSDIES